MAPRARLIRAETGEPEAVEELRAAVGREDVMTTLLSYYKTAVFSGGQGRRVLAEELRAAADSGGTDAHLLRLAAATLTTGPADRESLGVLLEFVGPSFRRERRPTWHQVVQALGASGDPVAAAAIRAQAAEVAGEEGPFVERDRFVLDVGLALQGDDDAARRVLEGLGDDGGREWAGKLYAGGLVTRLVQGDATAAPAMRALWDARPGVLTRLTLAVGALLGEGPPPPSLPVGEWVADLEASGHPLSRAVARIHRWRTGEPGGLDALLGELASVLADPAATAPDADGLSGPSAVLAEILRALLRWPA
jgi:hypothetical protein